MVAEDATPLVKALFAIIDAARAYLPPDGIGKDAFIARVLEANRQGEGTRARGGRPESRHARRAGLTKRNLITNN